MDNEYSGMKLVNILYVFRDDIEYMINDTKIATDYIFGDIENANASLLKAHYWVTKCIIICGGHIEDNYNIDYNLNGYIGSNEDIIEYVDGVIHDLKCLILDTDMVLLDHVDRNNILLYEKL